MKLKYNMKLILNIVVFFLLALSFSCCKTKEKTTERLSETAQSNSSSTVMASLYTEQQTQTSMAEEAVHTSWSDSIIEKFHERIVTDSCGRVLLHEMEHSKENFKGKNKSQINRSDHHQDNAKTQNSEQKQIKNDSIYNGGTLKEVTVSKKKTTNWMSMVILFLLGVLTSFVILLKVKKQ